MSAHIGPHFVGEFSEHAESRTCPACQPYPDPLRPSDTDDVTAEPYEPEPFPVGWDWLAAIVIAAACVAYVLWRWA